MVSLRFNLKAHLILLCSLLVTAVGQTTISPDNLSPTTARPFPLTAFTAIGSSFAQSSHLHELG